MTKLTIQNIHKQHHKFDDNIGIVHQYNTTTKEWKFVSYRCLLCDSNFKSVNPVYRHKDVCKQINTTKKRKEPHMPIQVVTIKGERYYRWGDSGKPYKNRADAEKQAAAAYASGYKEPMKAQQKK